MRMLSRFVIVLGLLISLCVVGAAETGYVSGSTLRMRAQPSTDAEVKGTFYAGTRVEILSDAGDGWVAVEIGDGKGKVSGYMMRQYLSGAKGSDATRSAVVVSPYGTPTLILRNKAANSYEAVATLQVGQHVRVIGEKGSFLFVQLDAGTVGCLGVDEVK